MGPVNQPARALAPVPEPQPAAETAELRKWLEILLRRRWAIAGVLALGLAAAGLWTLREPRLYTASVSLVIELQAPKVLGDQVQDVADNGASFWQSKEFFETQFRILKSRAVAERVVRRLTLDRDEKFLGGSKGDAVGLLRSRLRGEPVRDSRVVNVRGGDQDLKKAALVADTVA